MVNTAHVTCINEIHISWISGLMSISEIVTLMWYSVIVGLFAEITNTFTTWSIDIVTALSSAILAFFEQFFVKRRVLKHKHIPMTMTTQEN